MLVTVRPVSPQGTMRSKCSRFVDTFSASPCIETQRESRTPIAQIFDPFTHEGESGEVPDGIQPKDAFGLLDACEILREHSGTLTVRSRPGEGTCFVALLPIQRS